MITRRGLLAGIFSAGVAPAVLPSGIIMPVRKVWTPKILVTVRRNGKVCRSFFTDFREVESPLAEGGTWLEIPTNFDGIASGDAVDYKYKTPPGTLGISFEAPPNFKGITNEFGSLSWHPFPKSLTRS